MKGIAIIAVVVLAQGVMGGEGGWKAGVGKVGITPEQGVWMTGYGSRMKVSEGVICELYARAVAVEDEVGKVGVIVCADLLGWPGGVSGRIAGEVEKRFGVSRDRLILSCTHTHGGPAVAEPHRMLYGARATEQEARDVEAYTRRLEQKVVAVVGEAVKGMRAARVRFGRGEAGFVMNRRAKTQKGYVIDVNREGVVDRDVPVMSVEGADGKVMAVVFGLACHNTTVGGDCYRFHGDYAGFAAERVEKKWGGAVAMFVQGCGADANPEPRGTVELARQHGEELGAVVEKAMGGEMRQVKGKLRTAMGVAKLAFAGGPTPKELEGQLAHPDVYFRWQAKQLLGEMERDGGLAKEYPCPVQVWRLGEEMVLVTIGGEVVVDYAVRLKRELGREGVWVAGYCNDVFAYVPSKRVLAEGGYEAEGAMVYYCRPGRFAQNVEETIISKVHELLNRTNENRK